MGWKTCAINTAGNSLQYDDPRMVASRELFEYRVKKNGVDKRLLLNWDQTQYKFVRDKKKAARKPRAAVGKDTCKKLTVKKRRAVKAALETTTLFSNASKRGAAATSRIAPFGSLPALSRLSPGALQALSRRKQQPGTFVHRKKTSQGEDFRLDRIRNTCCAMTCCISVWGDGSAGPLGITVPEGMLTAKFIAKVNSERQGKVYIMTSGSNTHFMNAKTMGEMVGKLFLPGFKHQRQKHNLAHTVPGILQCDAFSGNFADSSGENLQRSLLFDEMNVLPPDRQPGGWSAKGQAAEKINGHFKRRSDAYTDAVLGFNHDGSTGTLARKLAPEEAVLSAIWAWETMDPVLFQWAFPAVGYVSKAEMAEFNGLKECDLQANFDKAKKLVEDPLTLGRVPELETPALSDVMSTIQPGEKRHLWQIQIDEETWRALPEVLTQPVEINLARHRHHLQHLQQELAKGNAQVQHAIDELQAKRMCTIFFNIINGRICSNKWISDNTLQQRDGVRTVKLGKNGKERRSIQVVSFFIGVSLRNFSQIHFAQARYCSTQIL